MDLAWFSLAALLVVIVVSCTSRVNAGLLAMVLAWVIALFIAPAFGQPMTMKDLLAGFPTDLFLTLVGVTLLFSQAQVNGTLARVARLAVKGCRGDRGLIPAMFFVLALVLSSIGAGNIAGTALVAPFALLIAHRAAVSPFLMSIMVAHGAIAGALSPISPTGLIAGKLMREKLGLTGFEGRLFGYNLAANVIVAVGGYLVFGGWKLFGQTYREPGSSGGPKEHGVSDPETPGLEALKITGDDQSLTWSQGATLAVIAALIASAVFLRVHVGMGAFAGAVILTLLGAADERKAMQGIPWSVILMVAGVSMLTSLLESTGGLDRFASLVSRVSTPGSITGVIAFLTGVISVYSSTSGVVLPAFLPMVPKLIEQLGGGDSFAISGSIIIGGHLVDSSPLSTIGALCIASAPIVENRRVLFNQLLAWGLSMAVVGAGVCYLLFGLA